MASENWLGSIDFIFLNRTCVADWRLENGRRITHQYKGKQQWCYQMYEWESSQVYDQVHA